MAGLSWSNLKSKAVEDELPDVKEKDTGRQHQFVSLTLILTWNDCDTKTNFAAALNNGSDVILFEK